MGFNEEHKIRKQVSSEMKQKRLCYVNNNRRATMVVFSQLMFTRYQLLVLCSAAGTEWRCRDGASILDNAPVRGICIEMTRISGARPPHSIKSRFKAVSRLLTVGLYYTGLVL